MTGSSDTARTASSNFSKTQGKNYKLSSRNHPVRSEFCKWHETGWVVDVADGCATTAGWRNGPTGVSWSSAEGRQVEGQPSGKQLGRKRSWGPGGHQRNTESPNTLATKNSYGLLGWSMQSFAGQLREVTPFLGAPHLCCVLFWAPQYKRNIDILEWVQQRVTKMIKG